MRVPSSMTRLVGMLKKSVMLPALRAIAANMRSRQRAIPAPPSAAAISSRERKNDVSIISMSRPAPAQSLSARVTSGRSRKP